MGGILPGEEKDPFMKRIFFIFVAAIGSLVFLHLRSDGFSPSVIEAPLFEIEEETLSAEAKKALSQPFSYLSKGRQSFVFESEDGRYVLKFFDKTYWKYPWYAVFLPEKKREKWEKRRFFYRNSYRIAKRYFGEEILFVHQGKGSVLPKVVIEDKAKRRFTIDLEKIPFVLQYKAKVFSQALIEAYERGGKEAVFPYIDRFMQAVDKRISEHIADGDSDVMHNWGVLGEKVFELDPGRLFFEGRLAEEKRREEEKNRSIRKLSKWLSHNIPEARDYLYIKKCK